MSYLRHRESSRFAVRDRARTIVESREIMKSRRIVETKQKCECDFKRKIMTRDSRLVEMNFRVFFYTLIDEMSLRDLDSLKRNDWLDMLRDYSNLTYTRVIFDIIQCDAKIEYIDSSQLILSENLIFVNEASDIIINDVNSQVERSRIAQINNILEFFISFSFELVSKLNNDWRRIHHLSHLKRSSINDYISREWKALKYAIIDETIKNILRVELDCIMIKRNLIETIRHISVATFDHWLLSFRWHS
jgi:hypothetical protein